MPDMGAARRTAIGLGFACVMTVVTACSRSDAGQGEIASPTSSSPSSPSPSSSPGAVTTSPPSTNSAAGTTTSPPERTVTRTKVVAPPTHSAASRDDLQTIYRKAVPVNPVPYEGAHPNVYFESPTGNIACYIYDENSENRIECTIAHYDFPQPGADCPKGAVVTIDADGEPSQPSCSQLGVLSDPSDALPYGHSIENGSLGCASGKDALVCIDFSGGAGFRLSRQAYERVV
jgi:hypothetical protein